MEHSSIKKNAIMNLLRTLMGIIFPLITFPYSSRVIGPVGLGKINFSNSILSYFSMIAMLGISSYGVREASKLRDDKTKLSVFVKEILALNLISSLIAYCLLFFALVFIPKLSAYRVLIIVCSTTILFTAIGIDWFFYAIENLQPLTIRIFITQVISLILMFVFVKGPEDYIKYAVIGVISNVGANVCNLIIASKYIDFKVKISRKFLKHLKPVLFFFIMSIATVINSSLDTTMLGFLSGDLEVGIYSASSKLYRLVTSVVTATTVILPTLSYLYSKDDINGMKELLNEAFNTNIVFVLPAIFGLFCVAPNLITLFCGEEYTRAITVLQILSPSVLFLAISNLLGNHLFMAIGKEKYSLYSVLTGIVINITLNSILIPKYGANGAGIATLVTEFFVMTVQILFAKKYFMLGDSLKNCLQCLFATCIMTISIMFIKSIGMGTVLELIICILSSILIYGILLLLFKNNYLLKLLKRKKDE